MWGGGGRETQTDAPAAREGVGRGQAPPSQGGEWEWDRAAGPAFSFTAGWDNYFPFLKILADADIVD